MYIPIFVQVAFEDRYPNAEAVRISLNKKQRYVFQFYNNNVACMAVFDKQANWIVSKEVINELDLPLAIVNYLKKKYQNDYQIQKIIKIENDQEINYRLVVQQKNTCYNLLLKVTGREKDNYQAYVV